MSLVACPKCHAQYDVGGIDGTSIACRCGAAVPAVPPVAKEAAVARCAACGALVQGADRACTYCGAVVERTAAPAGPVCPVCYARNPLRARHCTACGVLFEPQPVRSRPEPLGCPVCPEERLRGRQVGGLWLDECPCCQGLWAPGNVLERLVERLRERRKTDPGLAPDPHGIGSRRSAWQGSIQYRRCPECGSLMARKNVGRRSGVIVDQCVEHGTWLDAHEMEDIAAFALEGGLDRAGVRGGATDLGLASDPGRIAAAIEAEKLMAEERARTRTAWNRPHGSWEGIATFLSDLLK